jgi:hypothetical protein
MRVAVFFLMISSYAAAQEFTYEVTNAGGYVSTAIRGVINVRDSTVSISHVPGMEANYRFVSKVNATTYITDGVMTHWITVVKLPGKQMGRHHDYVITLNMDARQGAASITYFCRAKQ